jgi:hypothetical protein
MRFTLDFQVDPPTGGGLLTDGDHKVSGQIEQGTPDVVVGQFRPGSDGHNPPRVSIAIEINASGL